MGRHRKIKRGASPSPLFLWEILLGSQRFVIFKPVVNHNDKWKDLQGIVIAASMLEPWTWLMHVLNECMDTWMDGWTLQLQYDQGWYPAGRACNGVRTRLHSHWPSLYSAGLAHTLYLYRSLEMAPSLGERGSTLQTGPQRNALNPIDMAYS